MLEDIRCECGAPLLQAVSDAGVQLVDSSEWVPFRRTTDYVMCDSCMRSYGIRELAARTQDASVIDLLERLAARAEHDPVN